MGRRQVVRHWVLVPAFAGSNPADPAKEIAQPTVVLFLCIIDFSQFRARMRTEQRTTRYAGARRVLYINSPFVIISVVQT